MSFSKVVFMASDDLATGEGGVALMVTVVRPEAEDWEVSPRHSEGKGFSAGVLKSGVTPETVAKRVFCRVFADCRGGT